MILAETLTCTFTLVDSFQVTHSAKSSLPVSWFQSGVFEVANNETQGSVLQVGKANVRLYALFVQIYCKHHAAFLAVAASRTCDDAHLAEAYEQVNAGLLPFLLRLLPSSGAGCSKPLRHCHLHALIQGSSDTCSHSLLQPLCHSCCYSLIQALGNSRGHLGTQAGGYRRFYCGSQLCCKPGLYLGFDVECRGGGCVGACVRGQGGAASV